MHRQNDKVVFLWQTILSREPVLQHHFWLDITQNVQLLIIRAILLYYKFDDYYGIYGF